MKCICAVIIFVGLLSLSKAQSNNDISITNKYNGYPGYKVRYIKNQFNKNPMPQFTAYTIEQQQKLLEKIINLFINTDEGVLKSSPAARLARQRPFALVSPKPSFLRCIENCPTTNQYNPVCGSDYLTYHNEYKLQCAIRCGKDVQIIMIGICPLEF